MKVSRATCPSALYTRLPYLPLINVFPELFSDIPRVEKRLGCITSGAVSPKSHSLAFPLRQRRGPGLLLFSRQKPICPDTSLTPESEAEFTLTGESGLGEVLKDNFLFYICMRF